ncbi:hypothetical protein KY343_01830 [Candidatus Woesearchaeota archaeon]|nr:hypothetical protein [Candidatus Woesearchaeota archaeon]
MENEKKPISEIQSDAKLLDLVLIEIPSSVQTCVVHNGMDYASGFYIGVKDNQLFLSRTQKRAYGPVDLYGYPLEDIESYEIVKRYTFNPNDGIDYVLAEILGIIKVEGEQNDNISKN